MKCADNNDIFSRYYNIEISATRDKIENDAGKKPNWVEIVRRQVGSLRFGMVLVVVHDSHVTQIDKTERVRLERERAGKI